MRIVTETLEALKELILEPSDLKIRDDYIAIFLNEVSEDFSLVKSSLVLAQTIEQVPSSTILSNSAIRKILKNKSSFIRGEYIILGWNVGVFIGKDTEDEANVVDVVNIHLLDLKSLMRRLTSESSDLDSIYREVNNDHSLSRKAIKKLNNATNKAHSLILRAEIVIRQVLNPLPLTEDRYLASLYKMTARVLGLDGLIQQVEREIESLKETQSKLHEHRKHQTSLRLEWIVIIMIGVEVVPTLSKWGIGLTQISINWLFYGGEFVQELLKLFTH